MIPGITASRQRVNSGSSDPHWSNVALLLHFDGSNGSTAFTDSSSTHKLVEANGSANISTERSKFGGASGLFGGGYLSTQSHVSLYPGIADDFTVECGVYITAFGAPVMRVAGFASYAGGNETWSLNVNTDGSLGFAIYDNTWHVGGTAAGSIPLNEWVHLCGVKSGNKVLAFVNGAKGAKVGELALSPIAPASPFGIGRFGDYAGQYFIGSIDEFRITNGVARYTSDFTPPAAPFPNS